jgi:hypothetical protein
MPYFDENPLHKLVFQAEDAEATLDLRGMTNEMAMQQVERLIADGGNKKTWLIRFDPAIDDGRETLFLPLGRRLLEARRTGLIARCLPASDGAAYFIALAD